jgi:hypothetical protein
MVDFMTENEKLITNICDHCCEFNVPIERAVCFCIIISDRKDLFEILTEKECEYISKTSFLFYKFFLVYTKK